MQISSTLVFSAFAGEFYSIPTTDVKKLHAGVLPLVKKPSSCRKCSGRGHTSRNQSNYAYNICTCVQKVLDLEVIKELEANQKLPKN